VDSNARFECGSKSCATFGAIGARSLCPESEVSRSLRDRTIIYSATFISGTAIGLAGVLMGLYLARLDLSVTMIGVVVSAGLAGSAVAALIATLRRIALGGGGSCSRLRWRAGVGDSPWR